MEQGSARAVTSEGLIQVLLAKNDIKIMHSTRVELHTENHVTGRAAKFLVVALQLQRAMGMGHQDKPPDPGKGNLGVLRQGNHTTPVCLLRQELG